MIKQYFKQALQMLKESPLVSTISILGTALSIAAIMVVILIYQIQLAAYSPEIRRERMLYINATQSQAKDSNGMRNRGSMSTEVVKECFYALETPEAVTAIASDKRPISLPGKRLYKEYSIKSTDHYFWKVFDFHFLKGRAFSEADFQSGIRTAVINDRLAYELFETTDVVGQTVSLDFMHYTICGVVKEVSNAATDAYADIWLPYTTDENLLPVRHSEGIPGEFNVCILAKKKGDFEAIRNELERRKAQYNANKIEYEVGFLEGTLTRMDIAMGSTGFKRVKPSEFLTETGALLLFLLLVPALNLSGVAQSSVQRRRSEMGVRKAFGGTNRKLLFQILCENLVITCIGGIIGFAFSFLLLLACRSFLLPNEPMLTMDMLLQPATLLIALLFVLLMNISSAFFPAFRISRQPVVDSLKEIE
ncbi:MULTISPECIES: ABC transporter permease [unclassified Parabacteroides]|nr:MULTISPECIES: ABC transporter permease [unclassified Parabacteroides]